MALSMDPSRTTLLRAAFAREIRKRFQGLSDEVYELVGTDDAFGLEFPASFAALAENASSRPRQIWRFKTNENKVAAFRAWLQERIDLKILSVDPKNLTRPWTAKYIESAFVKGVKRAATDALKSKKLRVTPDSGAFFGGMKAQVSSKVLGRAERTGKLKLLSTRSFEDLKGISQDAAAKMNRIITAAVAHGTNPLELASQLRKSIRELSKARAERIARTEVIHAHAEGQLDSFEELGVEELNLFAEWSTAKDQKVCPLCKPLDGQVFTIKEARGLIPRHPNCRCAWVPAIDANTPNRWRRTKAAIDRSLKEEGGPAKSSWAGKRKRPKPVKKRTHGGRAIPPKKGKRKK